MKKTKQILTVLAIAFVYVLSTQSYAQTAIGINKDTSLICLTGHEFNYFIGCAYDSHTYKDVIDSLRKMKNKLDIVVSNDSIIKADNKATIEAKDQAISAGDKLANEFKELYIDADKKRRTWRVVAEAIGAVWIATLSYSLIK